MITQPEFRSGRRPEFWIFGRSQYFKIELEQEPKSTLRSVQDLIKCFKGPVKTSVMMLVVFKQTEIY